MPLHELPVATSPGLRWWLVSAKGTVVASDGHVDGPAVGETLGEWASALLSVLGDSEGDSLSLYSAVERNGCAAGSRLRLSNGELAAWSVQRLTPAVAALGDVRVVAIAQARGGDPERSLQAARDRIGVGVTFQGPDDRVIVANQRAAELLGMTQDQLLGRSSLDPQWRAMTEDGADLDPHDHPSEVAQRTGQAVHGFILQVSKADGGRVWLSVDAAPVPAPGGGAPLGTVVTFYPVSELVLARRTAAAERAALEEVQQLAGVGSWVYRDGRLEADAITRRVLGLQARVGDDDARSLLELLPPDERAGFEESVQQLVSGARAGPLACALDILRPDGSRVPVFARIRIDSDGVLHGVLLDVSVRRRLERGLAEQGALLGVALGAADLAVWDWRPESREVRYIGAWDDLLGADFGPAGRSWIDCVHPDDVGLVRRAIDDVRAGRSLELDIVHRARRADGSWVWLMSRAQALDLDEQGAPTRVVGVMLDISEVKQRQLALEHYRSIFNATSEAVVLTDGSGVIEEVNRAFSEITGYAAEEVVGRPISLLRSGVHDAEFYRKMWGALLEAGCWSGEIVNRRRDGSTYPEWLQINALPTERGHGRRFVAVFTNLSRIKESEARLDFLAHHDSLTGLANRLLLRARLGAALARSRRSGVGGAVVFMDLDGFKRVNDHHGHEVGDQLLCAIATRLAGVLREDELLARLGGDEFMVVLEELVDAERVFEPLRRIREVFSAPFQVDGMREFAVTTSIGVARFPADGEDASELMRLADAAMYRAKGQGPGLIAFHDPVHAAAAEARYRDTQALRSALDRGEIAPWYQPQVRLADGQVVGFEVLARWVRADGGVAPAGNFVPLAVAGNLDVALDRAMVAGVLADLRRWRARGVELPRLSVNVSARALANDDHLQALRELSVAAGGEGRLVVEFTEDSVLGDGPEAAAALSELLALGVGLSVDDFGKGYSSLLRLRELAVDELKIDRLFVANLPDDRNDAAIITATVSLANVFGLRTVAEGVETEAQLQAVAGLGVEVAQGFYFGAAMSAAEVPRWLAARGADRSL